MVHTTQPTIHLCQAEYCGLDGMREFYQAVQAYPTSPNGDVMLIRSHIAYHAGERAAQTASIRPSRGNSYRVARWGTHDKGDSIVRITDYYDHRNGVVGYL